MKIIPWQQPHLIWLSSFPMIVALVDAPPTEHSFKFVENYYHKPQLIMLLRCGQPLLRCDSLLSFQHLSSNIVSIIATSITNNSKEAELELLVAVLVVTWVEQDVLADEASGRVAKCNTQD